jgi:hypothetical protein
LKRFKRVKLKPLKGLRGLKVSLQRLPVEGLRVKG